MAFMAFVITIDGPVASGKGTLARHLGKELDYAVLDTGMLYRAVAKLVMDAGGDLHDEAAALSAARELNRVISEYDLSNPELRGAAFAQGASFVSAIPLVREALLTIQRSFAQTPPGGKEGAVLDGRDCGTVIWPQAQVKLFLTASDDVRAARRARDRHGEDWRAHINAVKEDLRLRDERDSKRDIAPLKPADDAIVMDTSNEDISEVFTRALNLIKEYQDQAN